METGNSKSHVQVLLRTQGLWRLMLLGSSCMSWGGISIGKTQADEMPIWDLWFPVRTSGVVSW